MPATHEEHQAQGPRLVRCAVITVSDTRTLETDTGGRAVIENLTAAGHSVVSREIIPDEPGRMRPLLESLGRRDDVDAILLTGGTGISSRDQTFETVSSLLSKSLPGYGEIFRLLSYQEIGPAAMLSRAVGGVMAGKIVLTMPGSPAAVRLAMEKIIVPQLAHLLREARR
jgi:molybdenum cofactor biosynthesis protein B